MQKQLALTAMEGRVDQHQGLIGVPVVDIVRRKLEIPQQLSRPRIERHVARGVEIVAAPVVAIGIGIRITSPPIQNAACAVVAAGCPRRAAFGWDRPSTSPSPARRRAEPSRIATPPRPCLRCRPQSGLESLRRLRRHRQSPGRPQSKVATFRHSAAPPRVTSQRNAPVRRCRQIRCALSVIKKTRSPSTAAPRFAPFSASPGCFPPPRGAANSSRSLCPCGRQAPAPGSDQ